MWSEALFGPHPKGRQTQRFKVNETTLHEFVWNLRRQIQEMARKYRAHSADRRKSGSVWDLRWDIQLNTDFGRFRNFTKVLAAQLDDVKDRKQQDSFVTCNGINRILNEEFELERNDDVGPRKVIAMVLDQIDPVGITTISVNVEMLSEELFGPYPNTRRSARFNITGFTLRDLVVDLKSQIKSEYIENETERENVRLDIQLTDRSRFGRFRAWTGVLFEHNVIADNDAKATREAMNLILYEEYRREKGKKNRIPMNLDIAPWIAPIEVIEPPPLHTPKAGGVCTVM